MSKFWKKTILAITSFLILMGAFTYFLLLPTYDRYQKDKKDNKAKEATIDANEAKIASLNTISKKGNDLDKMYDNVNNLWPDTLKVSDFIVQIEGLAKNTGLVIDSFSVDEQKTDQKTTATASSSDDQDTSSGASKSKSNNSGTKFSLSFKSSYSNALTFIGSMETLARLNSINSISVASTQDSLTVTISGVIYYGK